MQTEILTAHYCDNVPRGLKNADEISSKAEAVESLQGMRESWPDDTGTSERMPRLGMCVECFDYLPPNSSHCKCGG